MTTDNRTNGKPSISPNNEGEGVVGLHFSEAQVEAAAKALHETRNPWFAAYGDWGAAGFEIKQAFRESARAALVAAQGAAPAVTGSTSDGYHTFDELYEYRMLYNAHAAHGWLAAGIPVVKSWRHSDGEECFGGGWFIVTATLPSGQVSNHYKAEHWGLFKVPEVDLPPEYDGHTPHDAARRLRIEAEHAAPVLPSSGVDEDALAEVLREAEQSWHLSDEKKQQSYACGAPDLKSKYIARTVAEWLKVQGGESRGDC